MSEFNFRVSEHAGKAKETPPATDAQDQPQKPEVENQEPDTTENDAPAAEESTQQLDEPAAPEVAGGAEPALKEGEEEDDPEDSEIVKEQGGTVKEDPEGAPEVESESKKAEDDYRKSIEARLYQESGGKIKSFDEYMEYTNKLGEMYNELANKKPEINAETIQEINAKLKEERGYSLSEALEWQEKDIKSMPASEKLLWSMKAEDEVGHTDAWYKQRLSKYNILDKPEAEIKEMIEDGEISAREIEDLRIERDDKLHRADKILEKYKQSFDLNVNFEPKPSAEADKESQLAEEQRAAEVRAAVSDSLKSLDKVEFEVNLPDELGSHTIAIPVSDAAKHDLMDTEDRFFLAKRYTGEDGKFNFQALHRDLFIARNADKIVKEAALRASAEAEKRRIAKKDNVHVERDRRKVAEPKNTGMAEAGRRLAERFGRS